ncbi:MAG: hypothetical protein AMXMBFR53_01720 [Gemmatimonadota bacterium]
MRAETPRRGGDRRGFSLAELAVTVMIVGILAGVAVPNLHQAILKAEASRLVSEAHTIRLAAFGYLGDHGVFPGSSSYGVVPSALRPYLPENYSFTSNKVRFGWFSFTLPNTNNIWNSRNIGLLIIEYSARRDLAAPMQAHVTTDAYWSSTMFYYIIPG